MKRVYVLGTQFEDLFSAQEISRVIAFEDPVNSGFFSVIGFSTDSQISYLIIKEKALNIPRSWKSLDNIANYLEKRGVDSFFVKKGEGIAFEKFNDAANQALVA